VLLSSIAFVMFEGQNQKRKRQHSSFESRRGRSRRNFPNRCKPAPIPPQTCSECSVLNPKYKCPTCRATYCSVSCCRKHKEKKCVSEDVSPAKITEAKKKSKYLPSDLLTSDPIRTSKVQRELLMNDDDDFNDIGWVITEEMMNEMDKSDWLRQELHDGGLRQLVYEVFSASNVVVRDKRSGINPMTHQEETLLSLQTQYPSFKVFLDKLKVLTGVLERQEQDDMLDLEEWLQCDGSDLGELALKSLPSRRQEINLSAIKHSSSSDNSSDSGSGSSLESTSEEESSEDSSSECDSTDEDASVS